MPSTRPVRPGFIAFWMQNDASTVQQKIQYMRACHAGGVEALCIHPRCGNLIPYGSDEWFEMIRALVAEGKRLGMDMWLYDEDPFPSGAAGGMVMAQRPELRALFLARHEMPHSVKPGDLWHISENRVVWAGLVPTSGGKKAVDLTSHVGTVRTDWFMARWDSRYYYPDTPLFPCPRGSTVRPFFTLRAPRVPEGYALIALSADLAGEEGTWGCLPDALDYETFELFKKLTLERYAECVGENFGGTIPGIFTDEPKAHGGVPITRDLFESFREVYGYDLHPRLYQLFGPALGEQYVQTRVDYRRWVTLRFLDAFMRPYRRWCDEHGLYLVGHVSPEDDPVQESTTVGSIMPIMKEMSFPGTDVIIPYTGDERAPALNLGSLRIGSLRSQHGHPYAGSETLALSGWDTTTAKSRQIIAWQKALGVDRFFLHGFFTANEGVQNYEALPDFGPYTSIFKGICSFNEWLKSLDEIMDGGVEEAEVAVLCSNASFWTLGAGEEEDPSLARMRQSLWQCVLSMLRAHVGLHLVSEEDLCEARVRKGALVVGRRSYSAVIVPAIELLGEDAFDRLREAAGKGVSLYWCGGGPRRVAGRGFRLKRSPRKPGTVLRQMQPTVAWCRRQFGRQVSLSGRGNEDCYVRRFRGADGEQYVFAVNVGDDDLALTLGGEKGRLAWLPVRVDGETRAVKSRTRWALPAWGSGLFRLDRASAAQRPTRIVERRAVGQGRTFERLDVNVLRLCGCTVRVKDEPERAIDHPRPYWQLSEDYSTRRTWPAYAGDLPVESTVKDGNVAYAFRFRLKGAVPAPKLVLDPRCARGPLQVLLNGKALGGRRAFPLTHTRALRLSLPDLKQGNNTVELRFQPQNAMEGLLSQLYVEGDFDVDVAAEGRATISPTSGRVSAEGWQAVGLAHYMGKGRYRWREPLGVQDARRTWRLELEKIVDSAELFVNGTRIGRRAWRPWAWDLAGLKEGENRFELVVSGTAGNKHELDRTDTPQGWVGGGWLVADE